MNYSPAWVTAFAMVALGSIPALGQVLYGSLSGNVSDSSCVGGLQANASYTWSKAMGSCCNEENNGGPLVPALAGANLNCTVLNFDRTHNLQITANYELPFGAGRRFSGNRAPIHPSSAIRQPGLTTC